MLVELLRPLINNTRPIHKWEETNYPHDETHCAGRRSWRSGALSLQKKVLKLSHCARLKPAYENPNPTRSTSRQTPPRSPVLAWRPSLAGAVAQRPPQRPPRHDCDWPLPLEAPAGTFLRPVRRTQMPTALPTPPRPPRQRPAMREVPLPAPPRARQQSPCCRHRQQRPQGAVERRARATCF